MQRCERHDGERRGVGRRGLVEKGDRTPHAQALRRVACHRNKPRNVHRLLTTVSENYVWRRTYPDSPVSIEAWVNAQRARARRIVLSRRLKPPRHCRRSATGSLQAARTRRCWRDSAHARSPRGRSRCCCRRGDRHCRPYGRGPIRAGAARCDLHRAHRRPGRF